MGLIIGLALFIGVFIGIIVSVVLGILAIVKTKKASHERPNTWSFFAAGFVVCLTIIVLAISYYPFVSPTPGSDYDITIKNFFLKGLFYSGSPGVAAVFALFATRLGRGK